MIKTRSNDYSLYFVFLPICTFVPARPLPLIDGEEMPAAIQSARSRPSSSWLGGRDRSGLRLEPDDIFADSVPRLTPDSVLPSPETLEPSQDHLHCNLPSHPGVSPESEQAPGTGERPGCVVRFSDAVACSDFCGGRSPGGFGSRGRGQLRLGTPHGYLNWGRPHPGPGSGEALPGPGCRRAQLR